MDNNNKSLNEICKLFVESAIILGVDYNRKTNLIDIALYKDPTPESPIRKKPVRVSIPISSISEVIATAIIESDQAKFI